MLVLETSVERRASSSLATGTNDTGSSNGRTMAFEVMNVGSIPTPVTNILVDGKLTSWELALFAKQKVRHLTDACRERSFPIQITE